MKNKLVETVSGNLVERSKCRKIQNLYYQENVDCILMDDGRWNRIGNGKIIEVTDDLISYKYKYIREISNNYTKAIVGYDENFELIIKYVNKNILSKIKIVYGEDLLVQTKYEIYNAISVEILLNIAIYDYSKELFCSIRHFILKYKNKETLIKYINAKDEGERHNILKSINYYNEMIKYRPVTYTRAERSRSIITANGLPYNVRVIINSGNANSKVKHSENIISKELDKNDVEYYRLLENTTFGIELETNSGTIPLPIVRHYSFFPLRDGSINGIEYTSDVLQGKQGIYNLKKFLNLAKDSFKKTSQESLHVHIKRCKITKNFVVNMFRATKELEDEIYSIFPSFIKRTSIFKGNGKNYTRPLPNIKLSYLKNNVESDFYKIYKYYLGGMSKEYAKDYFKGFEKNAEPHPNDISNNRKWNINERYHFCNFIPTLFNNSGTVEFRLHPNSFNYEKIVYWILIINAIVAYAEKGDFKNKLTLKEVLYFQYGNKNLELTNKLYSYISLRKTFYKNIKENYTSKIENLIFSDKIKNYKQIEFESKKLFKKIFDIESGVYEVENDSIDAFM